MAGGEGLSLSAELALLLGPPTVEGDARWFQFRPEGDGLPVEVRVQGGRAVVDLAGYRRGFEIAALEDPDADADARDDAEASARSLLDLVGGALFGDVSVEMTLAGARPFRRTLRVRRLRSKSADDTEWSVVDSQSTLPWPPWARRTRVVRRNAEARPETRPFSPCDPPLPWAPWAGVAGYLGAEATGPLEPAELPLDGELDLHNFHPKEVKPVVLEYIEQCRARGITQLRIVHGKGKGHLRRTVHATLERHPHVRHFELGGHGGGGWGATVVELIPDD